MPSTSTVSSFTTRTRSTGDEQSNEAAALVTGPGLTRVQSNIIAILEQEGPLTDEDLYDAYMARHRRAPLQYERRSASRIRTARAEMTEGTKHNGVAPRIERLADVEATPWGTHRKVWRVIPTGARQAVA